MRNGPDNTHIPHSFLSIFPMQEWEDSDHPKILQQSEKKHPNWRCESHKETRRISQSEPWFILDTNLLLNENHTKNRTDFTFTQYPGGYTFHSKHVYIYPCVSAIWTTTCTFGGLCNLEANRWTAWHPGSSALILNPIRCVGSIRKAFASTRNYNCGGVACMDTHIDPCDLPSISSDCLALRVGHGTWEFARGEAIRILWVCKILWFGFISSILTILCAVALELAPTCRQNVPMLSGRNDR